MFQSLQLYFFINEYEYDECLNGMCWVSVVYFMNDTFVCVITSMNFLSCFEVRSVGLVMA